MLKNINPKRRRYILLIILLSIIPIFAFSYLGMQTIFFRKEKQNIPTEAEKILNEESKIELPLPSRVQEKKEEVKKEEVKETPQPKPAPSTSTNWWEYPDKIYKTKRNGDDLLVLVNKAYKLSSSYEPNDLVDAKTSGIRTKGNGTYYVRQILISDLKKLNKAAKNENVDLSVISAYRSYSTQASTYQYWVNYNGGCVSCADQISARAGHSQHQLATAIDFSTNEIGDALGSSFNNTRASGWLQKNAYKYGFVLSYPKGYEKITGYSYESWHYRYIGVDNAKEMKNGGMILEKYLQSKN